MANKVLAVAMIILISACSKPEKIISGFATLRGCSSMAIFDNEISARWKEKKRAVGILMDGKTLVTLYADGKNDTWTITLHTGKGIQCAVLAGTYWQDVSE